MLNDYIKLGKTISYALRHHPEEFQLTLDKEGWCSLTDLIQALRSHGYESVSIDDIEYILTHSDKKRYEIEEDRIRAYYGHSFAQKLSCVAKEPPEFLYHGTARRFEASIRTQGLLPQQRQYVHLSSKKETAIMVGKRHDANPVILTINAHQAWVDGIAFYDANDATWLCEQLPPEYIL